MVFKEESRGCTAVPHKWGKKMNKKFGVEEAPDWWSEALGMWTNDQRKYGKAFKKPASQRSSAEKTYAGKTTKRRVALLDGILRSCFQLKLYLSNAFQKSYIVTLYRGEAVAMRKAYKESLLLRKPATQPEKDRACQGGAG